MNEDSLTEQSKEEYRKQMKGSVASFAPGRIEFLGNHLDYNGGTVLGTAINAGIYGLAQPREDDSFQLFSESFEGAVITGSIDQLEKQSGKNSWGNYCLGVLKVLQQMNLAPDRGFSLTLSTDLPMAAGLSSSAAVELATALCLLQLRGRELPKSELVSICRKAENEWVGLPCGILDQGTSAFGEKNQVVRIDCAEEAFSTLPLPEGTAFWIFDTGIKHDLVDSHYGTRNRECMDALSALQTLDPQLKHLAHCPSELLERANLEEDILKRTRHVIGEQARVEQFEAGLRESKSPEKLGSLLQESHRSSSELFENSVPELDHLVHLLNEDSEVFGARLTGGGFGGAALAWTSQSFNEERAKSIAQAYCTKWDIEPRFHTFSPSRGAHSRDPLDKG